MRSILSLTSTLALALAATPLQAEPRSAVVTVTGAELSSPEGMKRFHKRIAAALEEVCGSYATIETYQVPQLDECWRKARSNIETRVASLKGKEIRLGAR